MPFILAVYGVDVFELSVAIDTELDCHSIIENIINCDLKGMQIDWEGLYFHKLPITLKLVNHERLRRMVDGEIKRKIRIVLD